MQITGYSSNQRNTIRFAFHATAYTNQQVYGKAVRLVPTTTKVGSQDLIDFECVVIVGARRWDIAF